MPVPPPTPTPLQENRAGEVGGAVAVVGGNLTLVRCLFAANRAGRHPAVYLQPGPAVRAAEEGCLYRDNVAAPPPPDEAPPLPFFNGFHADPLR
jgi:hypothetical protein